MIQVRAPKRSIIGISMAIFGTLGLAGSGILWHFQGKEYGLTGTITSITALVFGFLFLWPLQQAIVKTQTSSDNNNKDIDNIHRDNEVNDEISMNNEDMTKNIKEETTAESIARELENSLKSRPTIELTNFSNMHLLPGQTINTKSRKPGASIQRYRTMLKDIL